MIIAGQRLPILIATKPVDFRCGHQALALIVSTTDANITPELIATRYEIFYRSVKVTAPGYSNVIDEATEKALVADGVKSFEQIAALSDAEAHALEDRLGFGRDRIDQQQWREQARLMMENHDRDHGVARA